ncbi:MAG: glycosyltransferase [Patescibacteria group bacterium]
MRVIHIIPSAFGYFDDIRSRAFSILNAQHELGVEVEAITLQYESPSRSVRQEVEESSPAVHSYQGDATVGEAFLHLDDSDLVILHASFFGAGGKVLRWAKKGKAPFFIVYHGQIVVTDFYSLIIKIYNWYYLPRLSRQADYILDIQGENGLSARDIAEKAMSLYNSLV